MQEMLSSLVTLFRNPPPSTRLAISTVASHHLHEAYNKHQDINTAKSTARQKVIKLLYKEFPNLSFEVVAKSDSHVYYRIPEQLQSLFKLVDNYIEAESNLLLELEKVRDELK